MTCKASAARNMNALLRKRKKEGPENINPHAECPFAENASSSIVENTARNECPYRQRQRLLGKLSSMRARCDYLRVVPRRRRTMWRNCKSQAWDLLPRTGSSYRPASWQTWLITALSTLCRQRLSISRSFVGETVFWPPDASPCGLLHRASRAL